jgi:hypothetical protein
VGSGCPRLYTNWITFVANVKAINIEELKEQAKAEKAYRALTDKVEKLNVTDTHQTSNQSTQRYRTNQQASYVRPSGGNAATQQGPQRPGPYTTGPATGPQLRAPATDVERADMRQRLQNYPHQADTDAGQTAYGCQMAQWTAGRGGNDLVTRKTPVPLRPGTAAVCSGECYRCGTHAHIAARCPVPQGHANHLSAEESRWRVLCASTLGQVNRATGVQVYLTGIEADTWQGWGDGEQDEEQGNEGGSAA